VWLAWSSGSMLTGAWGVIVGPEVPGDCFVHFSSIQGSGYRELHAGQRARFTWCHPPSAVSTGTGAGDAGGEHGDGCAGGRAARLCAATW
jgi:cold shock CspA family protein